MAYQRQNFENGDVLTAEQLNHIEDELVNLSAGNVNSNKVVDLAIFMGQSNMCGRGVAAKAPVVPEGHGYEFRAISDPTKLYPIVEPFGVRENNSSSGVSEGSMKTGSMVSAFAIEYYKNTRVPLVCVSCAKGNTSVTFWVPGTKPFDDAMTRHASAKKWLEDNGYTIRHNFAVWNQGEADSKKSAEEYNGYMNDLISGMVEHGIEKCFIVRIGHFLGRDTLNTIINAQSDLCKTNPNAVMASCMAAQFASNGMLKDDVHYTQEGYNLLGAEAGLNTAFFWETGVEPYMLDYNTNTLYFPYGDVSSEVVADTELNPDSENAVQNKVVAAEVGRLLDIIDELNRRLLIIEFGSDATIYTVTCNLTNIAPTSDAKYVVGGKSYENTLTPNAPYNMVDYVTITMNGINITDSAYSNGVINIPEVTGDIVITACGVNVALDLDFANYSLTELVDANQIILDTTPSVSVVQDENGICMNGAYPNGFALGTQLDIYDQWCLEYVATYPTTFATDTTGQHHGILGGSTGLAPCIIANKDVIQIRFNNNDAARIASNNGYFLFDGLEHVYKIECVGNYTVNVYRDNVAFQTGLTLTGGSATGLGTWTRVLGIPSDYTSTNQIFESDGGVYCKSIKLWNL